MRRLRQHTLEPVFGSLLPHYGAFAILEEAQLKVVYCFDTCFNPGRHHLALRYCSLY
jgi:hypothetical protein